MSERKTCSNIAVAAGILAVVMAERSATVVRGFEAGYPNKSATLSKNNNANVSRCV